MYFFEVQIYIEAYNRRQKDQLRITAWQTAIILNMWCKQKITPDKLLGESSSNVTLDDAFQEAIAEDGRDSFKKKKARFDRIARGE